MGSRQNDFSEHSEARKQFDDEESGDLEQASDEDKSRGRSEGLDTLKSYLREIRRSTLLIKMLSWSPVGFETTTLSFVEPR